MVRQLQDSAAELVIWLTIQILEKTEYRYIIKQEC